MTNVHHSPLHKNINCYGIVNKGECLDEEKGEWSGANETAVDRTQGRITRIYLHSLDDYPHTGCSCFRLILFKTDKPRPGIGIMDSRYKGQAPDGRNWRDLHYELAGKQTPGITGASNDYLFSQKFLKDHGGWQNIVWVTPKIAELAKNFLSEKTAIGD